MYIAAVYDRCKLEGDGSELFSVSVITTSASSSISWLHHRMPVRQLSWKINSFREILLNHFSFFEISTSWICLTFIIPQALLETEEEVQRWLHSGQLQSESLLSLLHPRTCISLYPVCKSVNSVHTNGPDCLVRKGEGHENLMFSEIHVFRMRFCTSILLLFRTSQKKKVSDDGQVLRQETKTGRT